MVKSTAIFIFFILTLGNGALSQTQVGDSFWYFPAFDSCYDSVPADASNVKGLKLKNGWYDLKDLPFEKMSRLEYLDVSRCRIKDMRSFMNIVAGLPNLRYLRIDGNRIDSLFFSKGSFDSLRYLSVHDCFVTYIDSSVAELKQLEYLNIGFPSGTQQATNKIERLPRSIEHLGKLTMLIYEANGLVEFPLEIPKLPALRFLNIGSNSLRTLPEALKNLTTLEVLDIGYNKFEVLPDVIFLLPALHTLNVGGNQMEQLPMQLFKLKKLKSISVDRPGSAKNDHLIEVRELI